MPFDYHRFIIGQKGKGVREMMKTFDVNISIPPAEEQSNVIRITGTPDKVKTWTPGMGGVGRVGLLVLNARHWVVRYSWQCRKLQLTGRKCTSIESND